MYETVARDDTRDDNRRPGSTRVVSYIKPRVTWQGSLFEAEDVLTPPTFDGLRRDPLDAKSWIDVAPGWLGSHGTVFNWLIEHARFKQRSRRMWDKDVLEPRLVAGWGAKQAFPQPIAELVKPLNERYRVDFNTCLINLYRDGSDAVAWHADNVRKTMRNPLVATVSLGARRKFLVKHKSGGPTVRSYNPGEGDLIVMGGAMQHDWLHTVPREKTVSGARMSITLRHTVPVA